MIHSLMIRVLLSIFCITIPTCFTFSQKVDSVSYHTIYDSVAPKNDLLEFPMKDLTNMKVTVASKKEEKISEAPSSITAYSSKDIENLGYYNLADLASITSGYNVTYRCGESGFITRGQTAGGFDNNKHLLLIDGIPVNFARSYKAATQEELPLYFAQRVEFLKGPASALYGVSAFYGAVSVISKDPVQYGTSAESKFSGGSWDNNMRLMGNVNHRSNSGVTSLNVGYFHKNPSGDFVGTTDNPNYRYWDRNNSLFFRASHKINNGLLNGLTMGVIYMSRTGGLGESWLDRNTSSEVNRISWETLIPYLKYQRQLNKKLTFNSYLKGNKSVEEAQFETANKLLPVNPLPIDGFHVYKSNVVNVEMLSELRYELNTRNSFILGVNYDRRVEQGNPNSYAYYIMSPDTSKIMKDTLAYDFQKRSFYFNTISGYLQMQKNIPFLSGLIITGGLRYDLGIIGDYHYQHVSPRIAVVQKITPRLNLKMMTGQALRAPSIKELDLTNQFLDEVQKIKPDTLINLKQLKAEVIQTYEAGLNYNTSTFGISASVFYNSTANTIYATTLYVPVTRGDTLRGNWVLNRQGKVTSKGFEIDFMTVIKDDFKIFSNYSYAIAKDSSHNYFAGMPYSQINGGIIYSMPGKYKLRSSLVVKHIDGYLKGGNVRKVTGGYTFIDINCILPITESISVEAQVRNLLDQRIQYPSVGIPLPGRTYLFTIAAKF